MRPTSQNGSASFLTSRGSQALPDPNGRVLRDNDGTLRKAGVLKMRHYLMLNNAKHRVALARVILSGHKYGVETLRRSDANIAREDRRCRLCQEQTETPEHVWLQCVGNDELRSLRVQLVQDIRRTCTVEEVAWIRGSGDMEEQLRRLIAVKSLVSILGGYAYGMELLMKRLVDW